MKYTRSAITQLTRWYKQVLIKCAYLNAIALLGAVALPTVANAATNITIDNDGVGDTVWTSGVATTSGLHTYDSGGDTTYTHWVGADSTPLDDTLTMNGGSLITNGLTKNAALYANDGTINVQSGSLTIASGSSIKSAVSLAVASGATLNITGGSVVLNNNDDVSSGTISATDGTLNVAGGAHTLSSGSTIAAEANFQIASGATVTMNSGSNVTINDSTYDNISSGVLKAKSGSTLTITGGTHKLDSESRIANTFSVTGGSVEFASADTLQTNFVNGGALAFDSGTLAKTITTTGEGTVKLTDTGVSGTINGGDVTFTNNATASSTNSGVLNIANLNVGVSSPAETGKLYNQNSITTSGNLTVNSGSSFTNILGAALSIGGNMVVENGGSVLINSLNNVTFGTGSTIKNDGSIEFAGGKNKTAITNNSGATGQVLFTNTNNAAVVSGQDKVTFDSETGTLTNTADVTANTVVNSTVGLTNSAVITVNDTLTNNSTITNNGTLNLNGSAMTGAKAVGGTIDGSGTTDINAGAVVEFAANSAVSSAIHISAETTTPAEAAGKLTANANSILGVVDNDGELKLTGGTITKDITGDGVTEIAGSVINSALLGTAVTIDSGNALTTAGSDNTAAASATAGITNTVNNSGTLTLTGGTVVAAVTGTGSTVIDGDVVNNSLIKNAITINSGKSLTTSGSNNTAAASATAGITNTVANAGTLKLLGGYVLSDVTGAGTTEIGDGTSTLTVTNNAEINGNDISILANATLSSAADKIIDKDKLIANEGTLELTGGTTTTAVTHVNAVNTADAGAGKVLVNGYVIQTTGKAIKSTSTDADAIKVATGALTANASDLDAKITNNAILNLDGGQLDNALAGDGTTNIIDDVTNASTMTGNDIVINSGVKLTTAADADSITDKDYTIVNNGTLELTGGTAIDATVTHVNAVNSVGSGAGKTIISGFVTQKTGKNIASTSTDADAISVTGGLIANASDLKAKTTNTGTVKLIGGTLGTGYDITGGGTTVIGDGTNAITVTNNAEINGNDISILANATLSSAADKIIDKDKLIANEGTLELTGGTTIDATVLHQNAVNTADAGAGKTVINGFVEQKSGKAIKSTSTAADAIKINEGKGLIVDASDLGAKITNNGTLKLRNGSLGYALTGTGTTQVAGTVTNNATMSGNDIVINSGAKLTTAADADSITDKDYTIVNGGTLELTGGTAIDATVTHVNAVNSVGSGAGKTIISGFVTQKTGKNIASTSTDADAISVTGGLIANASDLKAKTTNTGAIKLVGGTLGAGFDIAGTAGTTTIDGTVTSNASIANTGGITVLDATASTSGSASQLTISASDVDTTVTNNGLVVLNDGTLASGDTITGSGKTTIDGDVTANALIDNTGGIEVLAATTATPTAASKLTIDADNVGVAVANSGEVVLSGDGTLAKDITGTGKTTVSGGTVVNNANITGGDIATTATGILETAANKISDANGIDNAGTIDLTGGTLSSDIKGGNLVISDDVTLGTDIGTTTSVANTTVTAGKNLYVGSNTLASTNIANSGTVNVDITAANKDGNYTGGKLTGTLSGTGTLNLDVASTVLDAQHGETAALNPALLGNITSGTTITVNGQANATDVSDTGYGVVYDSTTGKFKLRNNDSYANVATASVGSANNMSTAVAFDNAMTLANGTAAREVQKQLNLASKGNSSAYTRALTDVAPTDSAILTGVTQDFNNLIDMEVSNHLASGMNSGDPFESHGVWVQALYNHSEQDKSHSTPGFKGDTTGLAFGFDGKLDCNTTIGFGYAYGQSDIDSAGRNTDIDSHNIFAYGKYQPSEWFVRGMANYGMADYKEKANVLGIHKKADYDVDNYGIRTYVGYDLDNGFTPEAGLRYTHIEQDNYTDSLGQHVKTDEVDVLTAVIGVNYSTNVETKGYKWSPKAHLAFTYDITSDNANSTVNIGDSVYDIKGKKLNRFGTEAGVAAETSYGNWDFSVGYDLGLRDDYTSHTGMLKAKYNF